MKIDRHTHPFENPVMLREDRHPYTHGGGFGVATELLADPSCAEVLRELEPHRFAQCDRILDQQNRVLNATSARKISLVMENSPVVAALAQVKFGPIPLEWDLWLDHEEPQSLEKALIEHGSPFATLFGVFPSTRNYFLQSALSVNTWIKTYQTALARFQRPSQDLPPLCLDIKSPWSTANDIHCFIGSLARDVRYVASFSHRQIAEITRPQTILFCHAVWDLQEKVASGHFSKCMMLNGADLLEESNLETLRAIATEHRLQIGIYVQEPEAETAAIQRLIELVNKEPELFALGFTLGNSKDGKAPRMIQGSGAGIQKFLLTNSLLLKIKRLIMRIYFFFNRALLTRAPNR